MRLVRADFVAVDLKKKERHNMCDEEKSVEERLEAVEIRQRSLEKRFSEVEAGYEHIEQDHFTSREYIDNCIEGVASALAKVDVKYITGMLLSMKLRVDAIEAGYQMLMAKLKAALFPGAK